MPTPLNRLLQELMLETVRDGHAPGWLTPADGARAARGELTRGGRRGDRAPDRLLAATLGAVLSGLLAPAVAATRAPARARAEQPATPWVAVGPADPVGPIASGFVGLSMEYQSAAQIRAPL